MSEYRLMLEYLAIGLLAFIILDFVLFYNRITQLNKRLDKLEEDNKRTWKI